MASFFSTLSHIRGAEGSGLINRLNSAASITNCSPGILMFFYSTLDARFLRSTFSSTNNSSFMEQSSHLLVFLTVLSRKRGMFMRRRDGVILFFLSSLSAVFLLAVLHLTIKGTMKLRPQKKNRNFLHVSYKHSS